jgi:hypothetical protein
MRGACQEGNRRRSSAGRLIGCGLLLVCLSGCFRCFNPVDPPTPPALQLSHSIPQEARNHVYVFFINGLDPGYLGNLKGLRNYVQSLGYHRTYYGEAYHCFWFAKEIRRLHAEDPDARFAVVGFSLGTNIGRGLAESLQEDGISLDLLVCLSSNNLIDFSHDRPANVGRYIDVQVHGRDLGPNDDPQTERHNLNGWVWHFGAPSHPETLEILTHELTSLAGTVPVTEPPLPAPPFQPESLPTPRPIAPQAEGPEEDWQLLVPTSELRDPPSVEMPKPKEARSPAAPR